MSDNERGPWTSASGAPYDVLCQGRHKAQQGLKASDNEPESEDAAFGNRVHAALMRQDPSGLSRLERESYDACYETEQAAIGKFFGLSKVGCTKTIREKRYWIEFGEFKHSGQLDVSHKLGNMALIVEYKTLRGAVEESPYNLQLRDQVVLLSANDLLLDTVGVVIAQPPRKFDPVIAVYSGDDMELARAEVRDRVVASNSENPTRTAGRRQCERCLAKTECPEYQQWTQSLWPTTLKSQAGSEIISQWTVEQWQNFLTNRNILQGWLDNAYDAAKEMMKKDPGSIPGFYLGKSGDTVKITDVNELFTRFLALGGNLESFMRCVNVGTGKLEDEVYKLTGATGKKLDSAMHALLDGISASFPRDVQIRRAKK